MKFLIRYIFLAIFLWPAAAHAAPCTNPSGDEGDQLYNTTYHVMQYCNGQHWVAMGSVMGQGDNLGNHTAAQAIDMSGYAIQNLSAPANASDAATKYYADTKVSKSGDTMTGLLSLSAAPTANEHAANKEYVDNVVASAGTGQAGAACYVVTPQCRTNGGCNAGTVTAICAPGFQEQSLFTCIAASYGGTSWVGMNATCRVCCTGIGDALAESCTTGAPGAVCDDGAIYIGTLQGNRIYLAANAEGSFTWKTTGTLTPNTMSPTDGLSNTNAMIAAGAELHPAAKACKEKAGGGWYLPASDELGLVYYNSLEGPGPGNMDLRLMNMGSNYWTSTEHDNDEALLGYTQSGSASNWMKYINFAVRCVRR